VDVRFPAVEFGKNTSPFPGVGSVRSSTEREEDGVSAELNGALLPPVALN
jgi:hypothetical protein